MSCFEVAKLKRKVDAEPSSTSARVELLRYVSMHKLFVPKLVRTYGAPLVLEMADSLGDDAWPFFEQVFVAALQLQDNELAAHCLIALKAKFPQSVRVLRLQAMACEADGELNAARDFYDVLLYENSANQLVLKREIALMTSNGAREKAVLALNTYLLTFTGDESAWQELARLHLETVGY